MTTDSLQTTLEPCFKTLKQNYKSMNTIYVYLGKKQNDTIFTTNVSEQQAQTSMNHNCDSKMNQYNIFERISYEKRMTRVDQFANYYEDASVYLKSLDFSDIAKKKEITGIYICGNNEQRLNPMEFPSQKEYQVEVYKTHYEFTVNDKVTFVVSREKDSNEYTLYWKCKVDEYIDTTLELLKECLCVYFK